MTCTYLMSPQKIAHNKLFERCFWITVVCCYSRCQSNHHHHHHPIYSIMSSMRSFQPYSSSCIGFASNWQQADVTVRVNASSSIGSQTDALSLSDSCTVPIGCVDTEVQTGADDETKLDCPNGAISIEPLITDALVANVKQLRAFDRYLLAIGRLSNDNSDGSIERLFNLRSTKKVTDDEPAPSVLCIHWNSSGSTLAVGYGHATHSDWCTHRGGSGVGTWNLDRSARRVDANAPDRSIDLDSCVTAVRYNAGGDQQLLAIGTYVGDVFIADTDRVLYEARASDDASHRQTVSALDWLDRTRPISCARDGRVLVWSVPTRGQQLQLTIALQVSIYNLPRELRAKSTHQQRETGLTSLALIDHRRFVVGGETGALFDCVVDSQNVVGELLAGTHTLYDPVQLALPIAHLGAVYSIAINPARTQLVLTASADCTIRLIDRIRLQLLMQIELDTPAFAVAWMPTRPVVFAATLAAGHIDLYEVPNVVPLVRVVQLADAAIIYTIAFNSVGRLAAGDDRGAVSVWNLPAQYTTECGDDAAALDRLI